MLIRDGIPTAEDLERVTPPAERFMRGPVAMAECFQEIACNPCTKACPRKAIRMEPDMNAVPRVDFDACNGCGACILRCPGLAIFVVDASYSETEALVKLPFEFTPVPKAGELALCLDRAGRELGYFPVIRTVSGGRLNKTFAVSVAVPKELAMEVRNIKPGHFRGGQKDER